MIKTSLLLSLLFMHTAFSKTVIVDDQKIAAKLSTSDKNNIRKKYLATKDDKELAIKMLRLDLAPYIKTMNRDIVTYNYRKTSELKFKPLNSASDTPEALKYAREWSEAAKKHLPLETGVVGWGLYSAQDPFASATYAIDEDSTFSLTTIKYPKNTKMLDLRSDRAEIDRIDEGSLPLSKQTLSLLNKLCKGDYKITGQKTKTGTIYVNKVDLIPHKTCHEIYVKALESLNIGGLIYRWSSVQPGSVCDSENINNAAFVAFNLPIEDQTIDFFSNVDDVKSKEALMIQSEKDPAQRKKLIEAYSLGSKTFRDYQKTSTILQFRTITNRAAKELIPFAAQDPETVQRFKNEYKEESFGCSKKYQADDAPTYKPDQVFDVLLADGYLELNLGKQLNNLLSTCVEETP